MVAAVGTSPAFGGGGTTGFPDGCCCCCWNTGSGLAPGWGGGGEVPVAPVLLVGVGAYVSAVLIGDGMYAAAAVVVEAGTEGGSSDLDAAVGDPGWPGSWVAGCSMSGPDRTDSVVSLRIYKRVTEWMRVYSCCSVRFKNTDVICHDLT